MRPRVNPYARVFCLALLLATGCASYDGAGIVREVLMVRDPMLDRP